MSLLKPKPLPDYLKISQIAEIKYPNNPKTAAERDDDVWKKALKDKRDELEEILLAVCQAGDLEYEGDFGRYVDEIIPNSMPKYPPPGYHIKPQTCRRPIPSTIKIHCTKFKKFVEGDKGKCFPVDYWLELAVWYDRQKAEAIGDSSGLEAVTLGESNGNQSDTKPKDKDKKRSTRKDNLSRAIDAAIEAIGKKPSLDELWKFFQDDRDETGFIDDFTNEAITWIDTKGKLHDTKKRTFANRLSRIKM